MRADFVVLLLAAVGLGGCGEGAARNELEPMVKSPGRYAGIGTFEPGRLWQQVEGAAPSRDPKAAKLGDDEHIIVVLDSHTGEVRQCGDHSGVCVAMNPWSGKATPIVVPTLLTKHGADLDAEAERASDGATNLAAVPAERAPTR